MDLLIDTHTLLWFYAGDSKLDQKSKNVILDTENTIYLSIATLWEIAIKVNIGKLDLKGDIIEFFAFVERNDFTILPISFQNLIVLSNLPFHHKDPFDRIIITQAITENLIIGSDDAIFKEYNIKLY
ncbi:type II toxin-antitoxin system VapC family toxin [Lacihabitans soyangensis]|uniref:Type II toxin-antitoxin system VapC family toxin n=1 Tax=Lacihabitans soyangensis TaxID=869394 RepID=A0AAE3H830_9BACT|nr:type II toxin-antitoxin system VapC family toxin [Lacihabitans soyangensis]MCP9765971.1 type II toxin-antitoxin system VapC family toxin [Lacihabitans soyangensis]